MVGDKYTKMWELEYFLKLETFTNMHYVMLCHFFLQFIPLFKVM